MPARSSFPFLLASAFVIAALIVVQAGRMARTSGPNSPDAAIAATPFPLADGVSRVGDYTIMTFNAGSDDVLAVLDGRGEELFLYRVKSLNQFEFLGRESLPNVFATAKKLGPGRK